MKINNKGWGLREMVIMSSILLILLLIVTYYIYVFYNRLDTKEASQYFALETRLKRAAIQYTKLSGSKSGVVSYNALNQAGYIDDFTDFNDDACNGYVIYDDDKYESYIKCKNFTSENYSNKYE